MSSSNSAFAVDPRLITPLREALAMTDRVAFDNVTHDEGGKSILDEKGNPLPGQFPRGGPFGSALGISLEDGSFEIVGTPRGNNVVGSGIASRHAEDQAIEHNFEPLTFRLNEHLKSGHTAKVWVISSAQSCTTCHTKQEIAARELVNRRLIRPGHFSTLYGATYDETFEIAQFYDAQYADAMILAARRPSHSGNLIVHKYAQLSEVPVEIQKLLGNAQHPTAAVFRDDKIYATGNDERGRFNLYATAEVNAVRAACLRNRKEGAFASWEIDGVLYTTSAHVGPLLFAEAGWTKISTIVSVLTPDRMGRTVLAERETPELSNDNFLKLVASGYLNPDSIRVFRDESYTNTAQPMWARVLQANEQILYNGAAVSDAVLKMRDTHTRFRFAAPDITECGASCPGHDMRRRLLHQLRK